jgi:error-prone DNA polymerase
MGFYPPDSLVHEAQRRGIEVRGVDVNASALECTVEPVTGGTEAAGSLAVRIGLGYVKKIVANEVQGLVDERRRAGPYRDLADLASRSATGREGLERLAWAGACESLGIRNGLALRRPELWQLGVARGARRRRGVDAVQLALPLPLPAAPSLRELDSWQRIVADYGSTGITLGEHPIEVLRPGLERGLVKSEDLVAIRNHRRISLAGLVVARQRPATAKGVVFMLLEDECGVANVIVPPPVYERCRAAVRTAAFALVRGRLERRENVINLVADSIEGVAAPNPAQASVGQIEPAERRETGRQADHPERDLAAVAPRAHSFGRRR